MNQGSGAGNVNPASVASSVKEIINEHQAKLLNAGTNPPVSNPSRNADYQVADLFGRCFLRVCYWINVFSSIARRGERLTQVPFAHGRAASLTSAEVAQELLKDEGVVSLSETPPVASV